MPSDIKQSRFYGLGAHQGAELGWPILVFRRRDMGCARWGVPACSADGSVCVQRGLHHLRGNMRRYHHCFLQAARRVFRATSSGGSSHSPQIYRQLSGGEVKGLAGRFQPGTVSAESELSREAPIAVRSG